MKHITRLIISACLISWANLLWAHEPATHREIARRAAEVSSVDRAMTEMLSLAEGIRQIFLGSEVRDLIGEGALGTSNASWEAMVMTGSAVDARTRLNDLDLARHRLRLLPHQRTRRKG